MNAEILCVGTELLLGDVVNTNATFIARGLAELGVGCYYQSVVGDNATRLEESLRLAFSRADMVITTGGLGPTYDDITKEIVAGYFGREMELHQPSLENIKAIFERFAPGRSFTKNNEKQAYMPVGATIFENGRGTAPGLAVEGDGKIAIMLPGPPGEMKAMFEEKVAPFLQARTDKTLLSRTVHLFGIGESMAESKLHDAMIERQNPTIAPYAKLGEVQLRLTASAPNKEEARRLLDPLEREVTALFPEHVYGVDVGDMQSALVTLLREKGLTIALCESCTGGMIAARITEVPGASQVLRCGVVSYSNESKANLVKVSGQTLETHGAVSQECALEMAQGVRSVSGADIGLAVTGIAGPGGGTDEKPVGLVFVACVGPWGEKIIELRLSRGYQGERGNIRNLACLNAMNLVLRQVWAN
ncbi:MAG: competence/damage-inducible protein A [Oscillospiraceae bacterium]|nr:competence/damage-inducible protein A [Oscillospiraceae bacterium]